MKKLLSLKILIFFGFVCLLFFYSCTKEQFKIYENKDSAKTLNSFKISEQEAITSLIGFLNSSSDNYVSTKSGGVLNRLSRKHLGKIQVVRSTEKMRKILSRIQEQTSCTSTKSFGGGGMQIDSSNVLPDTLIYVVNFDDDGFALLSADRRISSSIIAVVESGSISPDDFNLAESLQQMFSDTLVNYGLHSWGLDEDGDEIAWEDTISVSLNEDEMMAIDSSLVFNNPSELIIEMISDYVVNELVNPSPHSPGNGINPGEDWQNPETGQTGQEGGGPSGGNNGSSSGGNNPLLFNWVTVSEVPEMLETWWFQGRSLNRFTPLKSGKHTLLGCGAIAVAQIIAYHEFPQYYYLNNHLCDWSLLKSVYLRNEPYYSVDSTSHAVSELSHFLYSIAIACCTDFGLKSSTSLASKCKRAFHLFSYNNIHKYCGYHGHRIINMLNDGNPVFISALKKLRLFHYPSGHSWVIDGYRIQELRDNYGSVYNERTLVHCNWGWGGSYNGYYSSGVFSLRSCVEDFIAPEGELDGDNYNWWFRIITYDNPNR